MRHELPKARFKYIFLFLCLGTLGGGEAITPTRLALSGGDRESVLMTWSSLPCCVRYWSLPGVREPWT